MMLTIPRAPMPTSYTEDPKQAAIDQWTADPCLSADGDPGSRPYFEDLLAKRSEYAPWMADELDYAGAHDLRVLDVGCGQGIDAASYAMAGARATGIDLTPRHVELARRHLQAVGLAAEVVEGDAESLPFDDGAFDRVSSNGVLHHTPDMPAALREIRRVLVRGGEARIIVYNQASFHYWIGQVLERGILQRELIRERSMSGVLASGVEYSSIGARPLVRVYTPRRLRRIMREAGFDDVSTTVRHYLPSDTSITRLLAPRVAALRNPRVLDRLGRMGGWYVIGRGQRPVMP
jgi:ubiquinone/menaquinone biosynthesis C-methylase UbiE